MCHSGSPLRSLRLARGSGRRGRGRRSDMWRMSGRDPGKSPVVTK